MARQRVAPDDGIPIWSGKKLNDLWSTLSSLATAEIKWAADATGPKIIVAPDYSKIEIHVPSKTSKIDILKLDTRTVTICDPATGATEQVKMVIMTTS